MTKQKPADFLTKELLTSKYEEFKSVNKISKDLGYPFRTIEKYMMLHGIDTTCKSELKDKYSKEFLESLYLKHKTLKGVLKELGMCKESAAKIFQYHNIEYFKPHEKYTCDDDFFSRDNEQCFYWAGFIAADGCIKERNINSKILSIRLGEKDSNHLHKFRNNIKTESPIRKITCKNSKRNSNWNDSKLEEINISSIKLYEDLSRFNIDPRKTWIYKMPEWLIDHSLVHHFLRGYNDGDGSFFISIGKNRNVSQIYFSLRGNKNFLLQTRKIIEKNCNVKERDTDIRISSGQGVLEYGGNNVLESIVKFLYKDQSVCLDRKFDIIKHLT